MNNKQLKLLAAQAKAQAQMKRVRTQQNPNQQFSKFSASQLYCAKCKKAMPVREKLLLTLPSGDLFDYLCTGCGTSLGTRNANDGRF